MENSALNQLPEVDSLPDGFVESSGESIAPVTPLNEREQKPLVDEFKDKLFVESVVVTNNEGSSGNGLGFTDGKLPKLRTFPVPLSENKEGHDDDDDDHGFCNNELKEDRGVMMGRGVASDCASTASVDCGSEKNQSDAERSKKGEPDAESTHAKGKQVSESQKNGKETVEVKRKSSKRTFKTEQEFLEFTLKYKQVLAERDAAIAVRDKLESLCRELQRQNKLLMDECKKVSEEGQNLRLDLSTRFQDAIKDVSIKLDEQKEDCLSQLKENEM